MSVVGFQDFWVAGARFMYKRDAIDGVEQPMIDLGVIQSANPAFDIQKLELKDPDGGVKKLVDESITEINETYDITCNNFNPNNQSLLFLSNAPEEFTQLAAHKSVTHYAHVGNSVKVTDSDADKTFMYNLGAIAGVISSIDDVSTDIFTDIDVSTRTITTGGDLSGDLSPGDTIVVSGQGLADVTNASTYTVDVVTSTTVRTVEEFSGEDETSVTGALLYVGSGDSGTIYVLGTDWEATSIDRGYLRMIEGGAFTANGNLDIIYSTAAMSGKRLLNPQSQKGEITGKAMLFYGRGNNAQQTVREARVSITPSTSNINADDYSDFVLSVKILSDLSDATPAGRLLQFKGGLPALS